MFEIIKGTPFMFDDGDHLAVVLKQDTGSWVLSDW